MNSWSHLKVKLGSFLIGIGNKISYDVWDDEEPYLDFYEKSSDRMQTGEEGVKTTHDELLAKINEPMVWKEKTSDGETVLVVDCKDSVRAKALRAVVELHTPSPWDNGEGQSGLYCKLCEDDYPCQTTQAIEKELE